MMCMVCNVGLDLYDKFAHAQLGARSAMEKTAAALYEARDKVGRETTQGLEYDRCRRKVLRLIRDFNRVTEHEREV